MEIAGRAVVRKNHHTQQRAQQPTHWTSAAGGPLPQRQARSSLIVRIIKLTTCNKNTQVVPRGYEKSHVASAPLVT